jgi:hypothetical protein
MAKRFHDSHSGDIFLDDGGHGGVLVVNFAPLRMQFARIERDHAIVGAHGHYSHAAEARLVAKTRTIVAQYRTAMSMLRKSCREKEILQAPHIGDSSGRSIHRCCLVVIGE